MQWLRKSENEKTVKVYNEQMGVGSGETRKRKE